MASTELVTAGADSPLAVLRIEPDELTELITENIGEDSLTPRDLDRVKVPAGGGQVWEIPTLDGTEATKSIQGVIVYRATRRAYWPNRYDGSGEQPACFSDNGVLGIGDPGGPCSDCAMNEFGTGVDEKGEMTDSKACKEVRQLFVLTPDALIPIVVNVPPGSLANVRSYFLRLMRAQLTSTNVITHIGLEATKSKTGIAFSRVTLTAGKRLDPQAAAQIKAYAANLKPAFEAAARVDQSEVSDA